MGGTPEWEKIGYTQYPTVPPTLLEWTHSKGRRYCDVTEDKRLNRNRPDENREEDETDSSPPPIASSTRVKFEIYGEEMIEKRVKASGNSGRVYLPPDWVGHKVKIIRID
jgi:putative transposon-encoded protein